MNTTSAPVMSDCDVDDTPSLSQLDDRPIRNDLLTTIQPGGGVVMSMELAWGRLRRFLLRTFRPGYVAKMRSARLGTAGDIPIDPVDARDVKFYRNQPTYHWAAEDDRFAWRGQLPFVRDGLGELIVLGGGSILIAAAMFYLAMATPLIGSVLFGIAGVFGVLVAGWIGWFFRNPSRDVPAGPGVVVSPADGKLVLIEPYDDPRLGRCMRFGIFLSIFNVHANRAAIAGEVVAVDYRPGKMLNALRDESTRENENLDLLIQPTESTGRVYMIRQITGQFARRIVCGAKVGDHLDRGEMYGMIKLGSRTELILPDDGDLSVVAKIGDKVSAGTTVMAHYDDKSLSTEPSS